MSINIASATIEGIYVHYVGNKLEEEPLVFSNTALNIDESVRGLLSQYFLSSFKSEEQYKFYHDTQLSLNEAYTYLKNIFEHPEWLQQESVHLAKHLYNQSTHPKIKGGEFYVVHFSNCMFDGETVEAIGLFKSENKDSFLQVDLSLEGMAIQAHQGINVNKLDKGCFVFKLEEEDGYRLAIVDNTNKNNEAQYWKDHFLKVLVVNNDFNQTNTFLGIAQKFVTQQLSEEFEVNKADQIDLLNKSVAYFKTHETFDKEEFENTVLSSEGVIESFRRYDESYRQENDIIIPDQFDISSQAVKKQARVFKSILKLDKNFHIYIHGDRELIEQGTDEQGRKFYKIYYEEET
jgi:hypothetical protein